MSPGPARLDRASTTAACFLAGLAGLHALWGTGSAWPASDRRRLAAVIAGTDDVPPAAACFAVAGALSVAAALVAGVGGGSLGRTGRAGVATVLLGRGLAGVTGQTRRLVPWSPSPRFVRLDRRAYGPLCLVLGAASARSARR